MSEIFQCFDEVDQVAMDAALGAINSGELIVIPTDTVYGIAADAFNKSAVQRLLNAKGRGRQMPPPVLIGQLETLPALASKVPGYAQSMLDDLWPGALTLIFHEQPSLAWDLGITRSTVAVRMPADERALAILKRTGPLAVSSANLTGKHAALNVSEAQEQLGESVSVYIDGGPAQIGEASTIVDVTGSVPRVLRTGAISVETLREYNNAIEVSG